MIHETQLTLTRVLILLGTPFGAAAAFQFAHHPSLGHLLFYITLVAPAIIADTESLD